jgi:hypothetical protein
VTPLNPGQYHFVYNKPQDKRWLDTRRLFGGTNAALFVFRGEKDAETTVFSSKRHYVHDLADHGYDPSRLVTALDRNWVGYRVADHRTPVAWWTGHCRSVDPELDRLSPKGKVVQVLGGDGVPVPGSRARMYASMTCGPKCKADRRLWKPAHYQELVKFLVSVTPPGKRPILIPSGCGMGYAPNREFLKWLSKLPGKPFVVASETPTWTRMGSDAFFPWDRDYPAMNNVLIFDDGVVRKLGDSALPDLIQEW